MQRSFLLAVATTLLLAGCSAPVSAPTETPSVAQLPANEVTRDGVTEQTPDPTPSPSNSPEATESSEAAGESPEETTPLPQAPADEPQILEPLPSFDEQPTVGESSPPAASAPQPSGPTPVAVNATIESYINAMKLTAAGEDLFISTDPEIVSVQALNSACAGALSEPGAGLLGCYTSWPSRIYLYDVTDARVTDAEPVVAAHELLHAVWYQKMTSPERDALTRELSAYFDSLPSDHYLRKRLETYESNPDSIPTELHSILGTEAASLTPSLESHYSQYFRDRQALVTLTNNSFGVLYEMSVELNEMATDLTNTNIDLGTERDSLNERSAQLNADIEAFNQAADSGAYSSQEEFNRDRDALQARQDALSSDYDAFNQGIENFNIQVAEYNALVETYRILNASLNIGS